MVKDWFADSIFIYVLLGLCIAGALLKLTIVLVYKNLLRNSRKMPVSNNKLLRTIRTKFETCYKLKLGVNNVDIFVDKYVYRYKICGILLYTWENICGQLLLLCAFVTCGSTILGVMNDCGKKDVLSTLLVGLVATMLLITLDVLVNTRRIKEVIRINVKDYLENFLKVSIENEELSATLVEQYKNEVLNIPVKKEKNHSTLKEKDKKKKVCESKPEAKVENIEQYELLCEEEKIAKARREAKKNELRKMIEADKEDEAKKKQEQTVEKVIKKNETKVKELSDKKTKYVMTEQEEKIVQDILKEYSA